MHLLLFKFPALSRYLSFIFGNIRSRLRKLHLQRALKAQDTVSVLMN